MDYNFSGMFTVLIIFGAVIVLAIWGCWELIDYIWIDDAIKVSKPIIPTIELIIKNNQIDTLYVYRLP
jgi:hypothetical protein